MQTDSEGNASVGSGKGSDALCGRLSAFLSEYCPNTDGDVPGIQTHFAGMCAVSTEKSRMPFLRCVASGGMRKAVLSVEAEGFGRACREKYRRETEDSGTAYATCMYGTSGRFTLMLLPEKDPYGNFVRMCSHAAELPDAFFPTITDGRRSATVIGTSFFSVSVYGRNASGKPEAGVINDEFVCAADGFVPEWALPENGMPEKRSRFSVFVGGKGVPEIRPGSSAVPSSRYLKCVFPYGKGDPGAYAVYIPADGCLSAEYIPESCDPDIRAAELGRGTVVVRSVS